MKRSLLVSLALVLISCNSTQLIESWKNPEIESYAPSKVLVVGLTSNKEARQKFENKLKNELEIRGAEAVTSVDVFNEANKTQKITESELKALEDNLINDGFDTVLFSKIIGVEDKIVYKRDFDTHEETYRRFKEDYLRYQDVYYNPEYYDEYTIYYAETALYCICPGKERELIWKGYINITDPISVDKTVSEYVNVVIAVLEDQNLINPKILEETNIIK